MAKVDDATSAVGSSAKWFKAAEMGMPSNNPDYWATGECTRTFTKCVKSLLR